MLRKNNAQVTMFVIIGIILIIVIAFLVATSDFSIFKGFDFRAKNQVKQIVDDCILDSAHRGTFLLGFQGGQIEIDESIRNDPRKHTEIGGLIIPSWDSLDDDIPTIFSMERELGSFIESESILCIESDLRVLEETFDIEIDDSYLVDVSINKEDVTVEGRLLISFSEKNSDREISVSDYAVKLENVRLGDMYELAAQIYGYEQDTNFMEELVLDQIYSASDYSNRDSMPSEGISYSCSGQVWTYEQLKENLINLNKHNFKYLQFNGTFPKDYIYDANLNVDLGTKDLRPYFENHYVFDISDLPDSYLNYEVNAFLPYSDSYEGGDKITKDPFFWKDSFSVKPSSGQVVKPITMKVFDGKIPIPCVQIYHHLYTLDYDMIMSIQDRNSEGNGYIFQFPLRIKIEDNAPKQRRPIAFDPANQPLTVNNENYCTNESYMYYTVIHAENKNLDIPLSGVNITYQCIHLSCDMGVTAKPVHKGFTREYKSPVLSTTFPWCQGGTVIGEKEGFHRGVARIDTPRDDGFITSSAVIKLTPLKEFTISLRNVIIYEGNQNGRKLYSQDDGSVYITIENKEKGFESFAIWPNDGEIFSKLSFLDDDFDEIYYNLTVAYFDSNGDLKSMFDIENWLPDINSGNKINIVIPASAVPLTEENFIERYELIKSQVQNHNEYGISFR